MQKINPGAVASRGKPSWNKGIPPSQETRLKLSKYFKGRKRNPEFAEEHRQRMLGRKITWADKISEAHMGKIGLRGELSPNWRGGKTKALKLLRNSTEYKSWREAVFVRDDYTCQMCHARGVYVEADHILAFAYYPDSRFDIDNGRTLCKPCHKLTPNYSWKGRRYA